MSLVFGGTTVNNVIFNGTTIDRIIFNGVEVYTSTVSYPYLYLNGRTAEGWSASAHGNLGGLDITATKGPIEFAHITVNGYISNYDNIRSGSYAPNVQLNFYSREANSTIYGRFYGDSKTFSSGINLANTFTYKIEIRPVNFRSPEYLTITDITYYY